jgi:hypothetical protein
MSDSISENKRSAPLDGKESVMVESIPPKNALEDLAELMKRGEANIRIEKKAKKAEVKEVFRPRFFSEYNDEPKDVKNNLVASGGFIVSQQLPRRKCRTCTREKHCWKCTREEKKHPQCPFMCGGCIVREKCTNEGKLYFEFTEFTSPLAFYQWSKHVKYTHRTFFENIRGNQWQKFKLDCEAYDLTKEEYDRRIELVIQAMITEKPELKREDIIRSDSHGGNKHSSHLVTVNLCTCDSKEAKKFRDNVFERLPRDVRFTQEEKKDKPLCDPGVYSSRQNFRMEGEHKFGSDRDKKLSPLSGWLPTLPFGDPGRDFQIWYAFLIGETRSCTIAERYFKDSEKRRYDGPRRELTVEQRKEMEKKCPPGYTPRKFEADRLDLKMSKTHPCPICKRIHKTNNAFMTRWRNGQLWFNCHDEDALGKKHYLGRITPDEGFEEIIETREEREARLLKVLEQSEKRPVLSVEENHQKVESSVRETLGLPPPLPGTDVPPPLPGAFSVKSLPGSGKSLPGTQGPFPGAPPTPPPSYSEPSTPRTNSLLMGRCLKREEFPGKGLIFNANFPLPKACVTMWLCDGKIELIKKQAKRLPLRAFAIMKSRIKDEGKEKPCVVCYFEFIEGRNMGELAFSGCGEPSIIMEIHRNSLHKTFRWVSNLDNPLSPELMKLSPAQKLEKYKAMGFTQKHLDLVTRWNCRHEYQWYGVRLFYKNGLGPDDPTKPDPTELPVP